MREVLHTSWPIVVSMLSYTAMGVSDTLFVGWIGKTELAGVGLATMAIYLVNSLFLGTLHGARVLVAQAHGAGDRQQTLDAAMSAVGVAIPFGLFVIALSSVDQEIFGLMGGSAAVQSLASDYFRIRVLAAPFWYVTVALCDFYQGTGDTRTPMKVNLMANAANIVLDLVMIFGFGPIPALGVKGAAWATVAASALGMVMVGARFLRRDARRPRWRPAILRKIVRLGIPIGVRYGLNTVGFTVFTSMLARMGEDELAAHQIGVKIISVSFLPGYGIGEAASVLVGQYMGAGRRDLARRALLNSIKLSVAVMVSMGVVFWLFPETLYRLFVDEPEVLAIGRELMFIAAIFQVFDAVAMTTVGGLNGAGDTRFTMLASIAANWFVLVPVAWTFGVALEMGAAGTWLGLLAEVVALSAVTMLRFYRGAWEGKAVVAVPDGAEASGVAA